MTSVDAALTAMDTAEQEARKGLAWAERQKAGSSADLLIRWAYDRLRLIQRDRETLDRHPLRQWLHVPVEGGFCETCDVSPWPCPDARAVINHWTEDA